MPDEFELARGWFLKAESDLNTFEFWPDRQTTQQAIGLASEVRRLALGAVPPAARP